MLCKDPLILELDRKCKLPIWSKAIIQTTVASLPSVYLSQQPFGIRAGQSSILQVRPSRTSSPYVMKNSPWVRKLVLYGFDFPFHLDAWMLCCAPVKLAAVFGLLSSAPNTGYLSNYCHLLDSQLIYFGLFPQLSLVPPALLPSNAYTHTHTQAWGFLIKQYAKWGRLHQRLLTLSLHKNRRRLRIRLRLRVGAAVRRRLLKAWVCKNK